MEKETFTLNYLKEAIPPVAEAQLGDKISKLKFIGGGSFGRVFSAGLAGGETVVLKAYRNPGMQEKEAEQLKILRENTRVAMPQVLFTHSEENLSLLAMTLIPGKNVLDPLFLFKSKEKKQTFADAVIRGMLDWHEVKGAKYGDLLSPHYDSWFDYYRKEKAEPLLKFLGEKVSQCGFKEKNYELLLKATEIYDRIGDDAESPVLIHGDLNIMNIMADPKTFTLTGFIDPYGSLWANAEYDLFQLRNMWGDSFGLYETYKKQRRLSENCDFKVAYYAAMNEAKCFFDSGESFALWQGLCNRNLRREMKKFL
ncbi:MAG: phosphotransferase [Acutalibacteraceae bacterium]